MERGKGLEVLVIIKECYREVSSITRMTGQMLGTREVHAEIDESLDVLVNKLLSIEELVEDAMGFKIKNGEEK